MDGLVGTAPDAARLAGKVALVFGAGSSGAGWGNGKATAVLFARHGATVVAVDRDAEALAETAAIISSEGYRVTPVVGDVGSPDSVSAVVDRALDDLGRIDVLHNNVGILRQGGAVDQTIDDWDTVLAVNLRGVFLTVRAVIPAMLESGGGSIVNVASAAANRYLGVPYASYTASKAGVLALTRATAVEFAPSGIRVNAVTPGYIDTPMVVGALRGAYGEASADKELESLHQARRDQVPMRRMGDAWDVANAALFLASEESRYVTGTELVVDGGLTAKC